MTSFHRLLARNLRRFRESYGWSRDKLSEATGISTNFLSEVEAGIKFPRPENLERLCEALRIQPADLFLHEPVAEGSRGQKDLLLAARLKQDFGTWVDDHLVDSEGTLAAESEV